MTTLDPHFPTLHRVHPRGWVNDPNGIMHVDGQWHVYFQYNPYSARHHRIHWGHMVSSDLTHWESAPLGPVPTEQGPDHGGCWSGVGVLDRGTDGTLTPTAVYSAVDGEHNDLSQVVRVPLHPDLSGPAAEPEVLVPVPQDLPLVGIRDPFVFHHEGRRWALQGAGLRDGESVTPAVLLYSCDDLGVWEYVRPLLTGADPVAAEHARAEIWECPQLVPVGERWFLLASLWFRPEIVARSTTEVAYLSGSLVTGPDGAPQFQPDGGGRVDAGPDFYAPQAVVDAEGDRILLWGWSWEGSDRTQEQTDAQGWAGCLTFPRELREADGRLWALPVQELAALRADEIALQPDIAPHRDIAPGHDIAPHQDMAGRHDADENALHHDTAGHRDADGRDASNHDAPVGLQADTPARLEAHATGPVHVELIDPATGARRTVARHEAGAATLFVDASILEILPVQSTSRTIRFYAEPGEKLLITGAIDAAWTLAP